jgi:hypothetical protein
MLSDEYLLVKTTPSDDSQPVRKAQGNGFQSRFFFTLLQFAVSKKTKLILTMPAFLTESS